MEEGKTFKNFAFISYSHADKKAAEELQKVLDDFHLSDALKEKYPDRPEVLREIFRDDTGLPAGSNLTKEIQKQLEQSNYLIVICSPNAAKSEWVNKEIDYFKTHREPTHIIPFIIDGVANAKSADEQECFPDALKSLEARGANISTFSFERAVIEVIAGALEIEVDDLWQRHVRAEEAKKRQLQEQRDNLLRVQSRFLAEKANALINNGDSYTASLLALEALPKGLDNPNRPYIPEVESVLRICNIYRTAIFNGHISEVNSVSYSPDGKYVVSASKDETIRLWESSSGRCVRILEGHTDAVWSASFSPNGKYIISTSNDKTARIWESSSGRCIMILEGHTDRVTSSFFLKDGKNVITASLDGTVRIWNTITGSCSRVLTGHTDGVMNVSLSPDGKYIVTASKDGTLRLWESSSGCCVRILEGHAEIVCSVSFSPNGEDVVSTSLDKTVRIWECSSGRCVAIWEGYTDTVWSASFSPDGKYIIIAFKNEISIRLWNSFSDECNSLVGHDFGVSSIGFSLDEKYMVSTSWDKTARIWEYSSGRCVRILEGHKDAVLSASFSPDGKYVVTASKDETLRLWARSSGRCVRTLEGHTDAV